MRFVSYTARRLHWEPSFDTIASLERGTQPPVEPCLLLYRSRYIKKLFHHLVSHVLLLLFLGLRVSVFLFGSCVSCHSLQYGALKCPCSFTVVAALAFRCQFWKLTTWSFFSSLPVPLYFTRFSSSVLYGWSNGLSAQLVSRVLVSRAIFT